MPFNRVRVSATMTDSGNTLVNPSSLYLAYRLGLNVTSINPSSIANPSTGAFYYDIDVVTPGEYIFKWTSKGVHFAQQYDSFLVNSVFF